MTIRLNRKVGIRNDEYRYDDITEEQFDTLKELLRFYEYVNSGKFTMSHASVSVGMKLNIE